MLDIERIFPNKYSLLLFALILILITAPFVTDFPIISFFAESILFIAVIVIVFKILGARSVLFGISVPIALLAVLFHYLAMFVVESKSLITLALSTYLIYLAIAIMFMLHKIFSEKRVTGDTVKGSISVYILIGLWWQMLYTIIWVFNPASFVLQVNRIDTPDFFYFSFTTMTTLGYGDVIPKSYVAKTAAIFQAITGQMYLAVLVARLVSLHVSHSAEEKTNV